MRIFFATFIAALLLASAALHLGWVVIPDRWNPLAPLRIDDEPNLLTSFKLARLRTDDALCRTALESSALRSAPLADRQTGPGCGFDNAFTISRTDVQLSSPAPMSCRNAVSLALWEKHVLEPDALLHFKSPLARIEHLGSYSCRNVYGEPQRPRSQHATADAIDISAFVLANGRRISVQSDWHGSDAAAQFLHDIHAGACRFFDGVLGPDYNAAHHNHFHLDRGPYRVCR